jgi:hypothetical protein
VLRKIVLICVWKKSKDPSTVQAKIDFWFIFIVVIPEIAFYIYGNCIIYDAEMQECRDDSVYRSLWRCAIVVVIYGYLYFLGALIFILFFCGVFFLYKAWSTEATF